MSRVAERGAVAPSDFSRLIVLIVTPIISLCVAVLIINVKKGALGTGNVGWYARDGGDLVLSSRRRMEPAHGEAVSARRPAGFEGCSTIIYYQLLAFPVHARLTLLEHIREQTKPCTSRSLQYRFRLLELSGVANFALVWSESRVFSLRHFVIRKITARANEAVGEVTAGTEEFQNKPSKEEDGNKDSVKDKEDQRRAVDVETERDLRNSEKEYATPKPMM
jgi:hypothetical protein